MSWSFLFWTSQPNIITNTSFFLSSTEWTRRRKERLFLSFLELCRCHVPAGRVRSFMYLIRSDSAVTKLSGSAVWLRVDLFPTWPSLLPWWTLIRSYCHPSPSELRDRCHLRYPPPAPAHCDAAMRADSPEYLEGLILWVVWLLFQKSHLKNGYKCTKQMAIIVGIQFEKKIHFWYLITSEKQINTVVFCCSWLNLTCSPGSSLCTSRKQQR